MATSYIKIYFLIIKQKQKFRTAKHAITYSKTLDYCCFGVSFDYSHDSILPNKKTVHLQSSLDKLRNLSIILQTQSNRPEVRDLMPQEIESSPPSQIPELKYQKSKLSRDERTMTLLVLILLAFAITWFPYELFSLIIPFCSNCISNEW